MDFGLLYENDNGEYVALNDVRMADIRLASLVYFRCLRLQVLCAYCTFASKQAVSITLFGPCPNKKKVLVIRNCDLIISTYTYVHVRNQKMYDSI